MDQWSIRTGSVGANYFLAYEGRGNWPRLFLVHTVSVLLAKSSSVKLKYAGPVLFIAHWNLLSGIIFCNRFVAGLTRFVNLAPTPANIRRGRKSPKIMRTSLKSGDQKMPEKKGIET